ncbi:MAG: hypothetical protein K6G72_04195 [Lachnospiraceae bacterium]|nr:hypothetical protein [Lachnospiraceae bacterium]
MKKVLRKLCVFLLAVTFFWKSLYGDIQYARADEFAGSDVTVTEGNLEDVIIEEDETPLEDDIVPADGDVSEGDVSGEDVSSDDSSEEEPADISGGDISGSDVSGGDVSGEDISAGDVSGDEGGSGKDIEDDPVPGSDTPEVEPVINNNTDLNVWFYVLKDGNISAITPEQTGPELTQNSQDKYNAAYAFMKGSKYSLEYIKKNFPNLNFEEIKSKLYIGRVTHVSLPDEYGTYESITESLGVDKHYGESGKEGKIESLIGNTDYIASLITYFPELGADGTATNNLVYATGDMIDWYVLKHADSHWHADGIMSMAKVLIHDDNKPQGKESVYTYDGTSKVSDEATVVNKTIDAADDSLPGSYVVKEIVYKDATGNLVSEITNVGKYTAVATVFYEYNSAAEGYTSYLSDDFEVEFPVIVNKRTVTITASNNSKTQGQTDPAFTGTIEGAVASDPVTATFWRIEGNEAVGTYPIYSTYVASNNYDVKQIDGVFTINAVSNPTPEPPAPTPEPPAPTPEPPAPTPAPSEIPGIVVPTPVVTPAPVVADNTVELEEEKTPLVKETVQEEAEEDSLDPGDVYPPLRDLTIEDDETPLAGHGECWIHWLIVLLTAIDVLYTVIQAFRNGAVIKKLKNEGKQEE